MEQMKSGKGIFKTVCQYIFRLLLIVAGIYFLYSGVIPILTSGRHHIGVLFLLFFGTLSLLIGLLFPLFCQGIDRLQQKRAGRHPASYALRADDVVLPPVCRGFRDYAVQRRPSRPVQRHRHCAGGIGAGQPCQQHAGRPAGCGGCAIWSAIRNRFVSFPGDRETMRSGRKRMSCGNTCWIRGGRFPDLP